MITEAKKSGADCIKFQIHNLENEMLKQTPKSDNFTESLWNTLEKTNITIDNQKILKDYCERIGIQYLCTPFSKDGINELESINVDFYKIGSGEMTNHPLIEYAASKKKPIIFSTGMSEIHEIEETVNILKKYDVPFAMTHCTSIYPCPSDKVNLRIIPYLIEKFKVPVGLSDHTDNIFSSFGAIVTPSFVMMGAPKDLPITTLRPLGPRVTFTVSARMLTPRSMARRACSSN